MKQNPSKITLTVIGGGSVNWMPRLMKDVFLADAVEGGEIRLVDPLTEHVEAVADLLREFNRQRGKAFEITICPERIKALQGADVVLTTFSPGAMDGFWNDLEIPVKYGIRQPVSMTVGPCGISAALRTVPVAHEIVTDMETACPGAWLLNVTNPMSAVTRAMNLAAKQTRVVGLCHEFHCLPRLLGPILDLPQPQDMHILDYLYQWLPEQGIDYTVAGINHFIWLTRIERNGEDLLPQIRAYCREHVDLPTDAANPPATTHAALFGNRHAVKLALCRQFGYLPLAGDRHLIEFLPSLCNLRNGFGMKYNVMKTTVDQRRHAKTLQLTEIRDITDGRKPIDWDVSGEEMIRILSAILHNRSVTAIANLPNRGQIENLPEHVVVETLADMTAGSLAPRSAGRLPGALAPLCQLHVEIHERTVEAALNGDRDLLIEALSLDPSSAGADFSEIPKMADELLLANKQWLPRFNL